jgi:acrylyl-CoA reductase (NADPH)
MYLIDSNTNINFRYGCFCKLLIATIKVLNFKEQKIMEQQFKALLITDNDGKIEQKITLVNINDLPAGDLLIKVNYSSLNYKDGLSATGNRGVTKKYPHIPGVDAAGVIISSSNEKFKPGDQVIVTGFDLGMNTWGGFGQYISVPAEWAIHLPSGLTEREAMSFGTAGLTAALSVNEIVSGNIAPENGDVVVSGASGGVGTMAVGILKKLGYKVSVVTGKSDDIFFKDLLGADEIISRETFIAENDPRPIGKAKFAGGIDCVSGPILSAMLKTTKYAGLVTCCGMAASPELNTSIFPFILRGVKLIGIDSTEIGLPIKERMWNYLADSWKPKNLDQLVKEVGLDELPNEIDRILEGKAKGRIIVNHHI